MPSGTPAGVGSQVVVSGACAAGYDGSFTITASTATSVSYALATDPGAAAAINLAVTGASYQPGFSFGPFSIPGTVTLSFASTTTIPSVGSQVTVTGITPSGYDGTYTVTASTATSVSYNLTTNPGTLLERGHSRGVRDRQRVARCCAGELQRLAGDAERRRPGSTTRARGSPCSPTNAGYTEAGLTNLQYSAGSADRRQVLPDHDQLDNTTTGPASLRFGYNRANGDIADAAAAARGKALAVVFVDDTGAASEFGTSGASRVDDREINNPDYNSSEPISDTNPPYISSRGVAGEPDRAWSRRSRRRTRTRSWSSTARTRC